MGTAIDLFVTYRFIKLLVTPFNKTEAFKLGIIDDKGIRQVVPGTTQPTKLFTWREMAVETSDLATASASFSSATLRLVT